jgi:hypothetical protein
MHILGTQIGSHNKTGPQGMGQEAWENCIIRSNIIWIPYQILLGWSDKDHYMDRPDQ